MMEDNSLHALALLRELYFPAAIPALTEYGLTLISHASLSEESAGGMWGLSTPTCEFTAPTGTITYDCIIAAYARTVSTFHSGTVRAER